MYEDDPQDKVFDVLGEAVFGGHPLGRAIIGRADVVGSRRPRCPARLPRRALRAHQRGGRGRGLGRPRRARRARRARRHRAHRRPRAGAARGARRPARAPALLRQGHRAVPRVPRRARAWRATTSAASRCACSTTSSAARRPRGCSRRCARSAAWPTASTPSSRCTPARARSACTSARGPTTSPARCGVVADELERFRAEPATAEELERSKENVKGRVLLALESTTARMNRLGSSVLADMPLLSVDEVEARIDAVELDDLARAGRRAAGPRAPERRGHRRRRGRPSARALEPVVGGPRAHDPRRRRRRGRAHGRRRSARPSRAPTTWSSPARADPALGRRAGRHPRRLRRRRRLHHARHRARQRAGLRARGRARVIGTTGWDAEPLRDESRRQRLRRARTSPSARCS